MTYSNGLDAGREQLAYSERLHLAWWGWPLPLIAAGVLAAAIHLAYPALPSWLPYAVLLPVMVYTLVMVGKARVRITGAGADAELWVADAHVPVRLLGDITVISSKDKRRALGPELDPAAYVIHRAWVGPLLRVQLNDPQDPTPYWVFSTRKPERVAQLLRRSREKPAD